ncbi:MerC domain-containing protein [Brevundimonas sp. S30B]|uniref:MerC domain-containing protein n=1 Tax=unclassified Brevundimonas TaxID=2622653 RepID=UPI0010719C8C|nr:MULTISPECIES: MerC domain-containing protein [unclassified Brevundimonas]QBX37697.1 MerC domain-containing protein [Brevundimonas sp. MF30-B]TFW00561.1 MerC domain-containing protein [Brevundimonas sp. S30B]
MSVNRSAALGDSLALGLSGLCLIHCLALPLAASLLPLAGAWAEAEWVHWLFIAGAAPVSAFTFARVLPRSPWLIGLAVAGLALLTAGAAEFPNHEAETAVTVLGSLLLAAAHLANWRQRRTCA